MNLRITYMDFEDLRTECLIVQRSIIGMLARAIGR
jgi:hypothetical protein